MIDKFKPVFNTRMSIFLVLAVFFGILSIYGLRSNYSKMTELRNEVAVADQQNGDVEKALQELRKHVISHMNTNLSSGNAAIKPPIQLKYRYERLQAQDTERVKAYNTQVNNDGTTLCTQKFPESGYNPPRVQCLQDYVAQKSIASSSISDSLYKFDFISPKWSPDLAGISLFVSILSMSIFVLSVAVKQIKKRLL